MLALCSLYLVYGDKFVEWDDYLCWRWKRHGSKRELSASSPKAPRRVGEGVIAQENVTVGRRYNGVAWVSGAVIAA